MKKYIVIFVLFISSAFAYTPDVIVKIYEESAVGDKNQIVGVENALKDHNPDLQIIDRPCNAKTNISELVNEITGLQTSSPGKKHLIIGLGKTAFSVFSQLAEIEHTHHKTLALGHQWTPAYDSLIGKVTWIAVPEYAIPTSLTETPSTKIIHTNGVSHAVTKESLQAEYDEYKKTQLPITSADRVIILGGDAPNALGETQLFSESDVNELADGIVNESACGTFYITNGPRTGKHDSITGTHKDGNVDKITKALIDALKNKGVSAERIKLFNFQFGQKSLYLPLVGGALVAGSVVWTPGESSSMICEIISSIIPANVVIYDNSAMNETHIKHVKSVCEQQGRARHYSNGSMKGLTTENVVVLADARNQIVQTITEANVR